MISSPRQWVHGHSPSQCLYTLQASACALSRQSVRTLQLRASTPDQICVSWDKFSFARQFKRVLANLILSMNSLLKWRHRSNLLLLLYLTYFLIRSVGSTDSTKTSSNKVRNYFIWYFISQVFCYLTFDFYDFFIYLYHPPFFPK